MKKFQRSLILFLISLFSVFVLAIALVPLANSISPSRYQTLTKFSLPSPANITAMPVLPKNHNADSEYTQYMPVINKSAVGCYVPQDYPNIQEAVNDPSCDPVNVAAGTFFENVVIGRDVTIHGAGITSTVVNGSYRDRVFDIQPGLAVTITNLTVRNGWPHEYAGGGIQVTSGTLTTNLTVRNGWPFLYAGGGIQVTSGTLTVVDALITANTSSYGGGICGYASTITIRQSQVVNNSADYAGGGIAGSVLIIDNSIIAHNTASYGGGIANGDLLTVTQSLISSNSAEEEGGGIWANDYASVTIINSHLSNNHARFGGGISSSDGLLVEVKDSVISGNSAGGGAGMGIRGTLILVNSTVSNNSASSTGGGILLYHNGASEIRNSTISNNSAAAGGGMYIEGADTVAMAGSIIAGNSGADCSGTITSQGYNIAGDSSCNLNGPGDMNNTDPQLGLLQDNGGPTHTHLPLAGSPAIDAGDPLNCPPTDQRGAPRPYDGDGDGNAVCDIGSVEFMSPVPSYYAVYLRIIPKP